MRHRITRGRSADSSGARWRRLGRGVPPERVPSQSPGAGAPVKAWRWAVAEAGRLAVSRVAAISPFEAGVRLRETSVSLHFSGKWYLRELTPSDGFGSGEPNPANARYTPTLAAVGNRGWNCT